MQRIPHGDQAQARSTQEGNTLCQKLVPIFRQQPEKAASHTSQHPVWQDRSLTAHSAEFGRSTPCRGLAGKPAFSSTTTAAARTRLSPARRKAASRPDTSVFKLRQSLPCSFLLQPGGPITGRIWGSMGRAQGLGASRVEPRSRPAAPALVPQAQGTALPEQQPLLRGVPTGHSSAEPPTPDRHHLHSTAPAPTIPTPLRGEAGPRPLPVPEPLPARAGSAPVTVAAEALALPQQGPVQPQHLGAAGRCHVADTARVLPRRGPFPRPQRPGLRQSPEPPSARSAGLSARLHGGQAGDRKSVV